MTGDGPEYSPREHALALVMLVLTPLFWASHSVVGRLVANDIPTFSLVGIRWAVAALIFFICVHRTVIGQWHLIKRHWRYLVLTGLIGPAMFPCLLYNGLKTSTATNASIIQTIVPALVPVLGWFLWRERLRPIQIAGILISAIGVAVILTQGDVGALAGLQFVIGDLFLLGGFIGWAFYTALIRMKPPEMSSNTVLASQMAVAALAIAPLWALEAASGQLIPMTQSAWLAIAFIVIFPTLGAYFFYSHVVRIAGVTKAGLASHLMPPLGVILAVVFLGEQFLAFHAVGIAVIFSGVFLVIRGGRGKKTS
ncbi:MAG: DMT family transporter [Proteobacteria bacterium]|nr:DMT family transporter [Pseudomonadota bacterium]